MHELKCWPAEFDALDNETKMFEFRRDDRGFQCGDLLLLREWSPGLQKYTGRELYRVITYILRDVGFGVPEGYAVLSLRVQ